MSTLDDDPAGIAPALGTDESDAPRPVPASAARLLEVRCVACERRFSTDVGLCPWCGHASSVAVVVDPPPVVTPPPPRRRLTTPLVNRVAVAGAVGVLGALLVVVVGAWMLLGHGSDAGRSIAGGTSAVAAATFAPAAPAPGSTSARSPTATSATSSTTPSTTVTTVTAVTAATAATASVAPSTPTATADPAVDVVRAYARAMTARDWSTAGALIPSVKATPADYALLYHALRSVSVVVLRSADGPVAASRYVYAGQVLVEANDGATTSRVVCARYTVDVEAGVINELRASDLETVAGVASVDGVRTEFSRCPSA